MLYVHSVVAGGTREGEKSEIPRFYSAFPVISDPKYTVPSNPLLEELLVDFFTVVFPLLLLPGR